MFALTRTSDLDVEKANLKMKTRKITDQKFAFNISDIISKQRMAASAKSCIPLEKLILYFLSMFNFTIFLRAVILNSLKTGTDS